MHKKNLISILLLVFSLSAFSQQESSNKKMNSIDLSLGGIGIGASVNYSRVIVSNPSNFLNASLGVGFLPFTGGFTLPHGLSYNLGKSSSFLELGLHGVYWTGEDNSNVKMESKSSYMISPLIGWKKEFNNHLVFRVYANSFVHVSGEYFIEKYTVVPYLGLSLGYKF